MTLVLDSSALVAILTSEPDAPSLTQTLAAAEPPFLCCPITVYETAVAFARVRHCSIVEAAALVDKALSRLAIRVEPTTHGQAARAIEAFDRFGKGRHPAALNLGDCFSLALAKDQAAPLLFKGDDFAHPEVQAELNR
jgi:ribonuclease VapC